MSSPIDMRLVQLVGAAALVLVIGTANAAGYRFGVSDQAFYVPAIALSANPDLFPRDRAVFEPQMRFWLGDELLGRVVAVTGVSLPVLFGLLYVATMALLAAAVVSISRSLGGDWWVIVLALVLVTLRHRIARTGANSLEGYLHPRMLAFACGLAGLACAIRLRMLRALAWTMVSAVAHTSTALWFGVVLAVAAFWRHRHRRHARLAAAAVVGGGLVVAIVAAATWPRMDADWLAVLGDRDYLFSLDWPVYAWASNLAYPVVLLAIHRRRQRLGLATPGETGVVAGLIALVVLFVASLPLAEWHVAFFVQLQANRVFWLLDAVVAVSLAWWLMADVARTWPGAARAGLVAAFCALAVARGGFVLAQTGRPLAELRPETAWTDAMAWLAHQPSDWHVLADPDHAWKYGISVRASALRDTLLERGKDPAMAMYDRELAMRVAERTSVLQDFADWQLPDDVRAVARRYDVDVFVDTTTRAFPFPVLYRNDAFVIYDLR